MPKVSVVIPVYNTERYLARCLESVLGQTERDLEIICVDDGSTDGSPEVLAQLARRDPRVRVLRQENKRQGAARNAGLAVALGDYVMFVDSDDWIPPDAVAKFLAVAEASGAPVVASGDYLKDRRPEPSPQPARWTLKRSPLEDMIADRKLRSTVCNKLYRREALAERRFLEGIFYEDWPFLVDVFARIGGFALIAEPLYVYYTNADAQSTIHSRFTVGKVDDYLTGIRHVLDGFAGTNAEGPVCRRAGMAAAMLINHAVRTHEADVVGRMLDGLGEILARHSGLRRRIPLKSRFRLWRASKFRRVSR